MRSVLRPTLFLLAAVAAPLVVAGTAAAQDAGTIGAFTADDFFIGVQYPKDHNLSDFDVARFFNKANCDCDTEVTVYIALTDTGFAKKMTGVDNTGNIEYWIGTSCADPNLRAFRCVQLKSQTLQAFLIAGRDSVPTTARVLSTYTASGVIDGGVTGGTPFVPNPDCTLPIETFDQTIWVLSNKNGTPTTLKTRDVHIDLTPPPAPDSNGITLESGNEALIISWPGVDSTITTDLQGYQVLCNRGGDLQVFNSGTFKAQFLSCDRTSADGGVLGFQKDFVCSDFLGPPVRSARVKILQNDITYGVAVVAIDKSGNASIPDIFYGKPVKTKSFYDVYRNDDPAAPGAATGGLCTVSPGATAPGILGGACAALAIVGLVLTRRRRK